MDPKPDAVLFSQSFNVNFDPRITNLDAAKDASTKHLQDKLFDGVPIATGRDSLYDKKFGRVDPHGNHFIKYPFGHPNQGQHAYEWYVARRVGDDYELVHKATEADLTNRAIELCIGFRLDDPFSDEKTNAAITTALKARHDAIVGSPEHAKMMADLKAKFKAEEEAEKAQAVTHE